MLAMVVLTMLVWVEETGIHGDNTNRAAHRRDNGRGERRAMAGRAGATGGAARRGGRGRRRGGRGRGGGGGGGGGARVAAPGRAEGGGRGGGPLFYPPRFPFSG